MRVVGYVRVSTDKQAEEGLGLEVQERAVRAWARAHGHRLVALVRDEGLSGSAGVVDRPGLAEAIGMLRARGGSGRRAEGLVVARLDRLARDLVLQEQLLAEVWRMGGQVFSTIGGEAAYLQNDPSDPSRALIRHVLGAVAQYERSIIRLRLMAGRQRKAEQGGFIGGRPAYGRRVEDGELCADVDEQETLRRLVQLRREGYSLRRAGEVLMVEGHRPRSAQRWHPKVLATMLDRATG